ncbi:unnamed protein product [Angiostrongylus costaricensis]|uniref:SET domain-containing protein n=1 Tax=Angiostrongylus costaricensis TaxID=334426 RepID=A0A0R3PI64_ANGCS|nr:unnamed protein product [Angiostrongylus costaricensis]
MPLCAAVEKRLPTTYQFTNVQQVPGAKQYVVDASRMGNVTRYFNHACGDVANLEAVPLFSRGNLLTNNMIFFTRRSISRGEELTFSYHGKDSKKRKNGVQCLYCSEDERTTEDCQNLLLCHKNGAQKSREVTLRLSFKNASRDRMSVIIEISQLTPYLVSASKY